MFFSKTIALLGAFTVGTYAAPQPYEGCYGSSADLVNLGPYPYQSPGYCQMQCARHSHNVMALKNGNECWCGDAVPNPGSQLPESACNMPCAGWPMDSCGGRDAWSFYSIIPVSSSTPPYTPTSTPVWPTSTPVWPTSTPIWTPAPWPTPSEPCSTPIPIPTWPPVTFTTLAA